MARHLSYDDRLDMKKCFKLEFSLFEITKILNRHKSAIPREISLRTELNKKGYYRHSYNACVYRYDCALNNICKKTKCRKKYKYYNFCSDCNDNCEYFKEEICKKLDSSPYVCNAVKAEINVL